MITLDGVGVEFAKSKKNRRLLELISRGRSGTDSNSFWALKDISFDVSRGESIGVVGRNGQGKSTLLKVVAGVLVPDLGTVEVTEGVAPLIELTGGFSGDLTGAENIRLVGGLHGMPRAEIDEKYDEIVDFAEVREHLNVPFRHYSSGMKVRLAFSVVSQMREPIFLVDEVLAVGDAAFKKKCYRRIDQLLGDGQTLFLVSHSKTDLKRFCTRGLYLRKGELIQDDSMDAVLDRYQQEEGA